MATSGRSQIMDRVLALLATITTGNGYLTDVASVSEQVKQFNELKLRDIPALIPLDTNEERETEAFPNGSSYGQKGTLSLRVSAVVYDKYDSTRTKRLNLMQDVEKALMNDATLKNLGVWIEPGRIVTDNGDIRFYSVWDQYFDLTYYYNRSDGG